MIAQIGGGGARTHKEVDVSQERKNIYYTRTPPNIAAVARFWYTDTLGYVRAQQQEKPTVNT